MHMGMVNRLPRSFAAIDADVEAAYRSIPSKDIYPHFVQQLIDGASLWFQQIKERGAMPFGYHQRGAIP